MKILKNELKVNQKTEHREKYDHTILNDCCIFTP